MGSMALNQFVEEAVEAFMEVDREVKAIMEENQ